MDEPVGGLVRADGWWRVHTPASWPVRVGVVDRTGDASVLRRACDRARSLIWAEQVHGASLAFVSRLDAAEQTIAGCDALTAEAPGASLVIRTADCVPIIVADPVRRAVAAAHAGWRGIAAGIPLRTIRTLAELSSSLSKNLWVWIGPCIRTCCYEVGAEFRARFGPFVQERRGRLWCDLPAAAADQLRRAGVPAARIVDSGLCTACDVTRWYSVRREGQQTGRLLTFVWLRPWSRARAATAA